MWILIIIIAVVAVAAAGTPNNFGISVSEDCKTVTMHNPLAYLKHELAVLRAHGWTSTPESRDETQLRILTSLFEAFPACEGIVPDSFGDFDFGKLVDRVYDLSQSAKPTPGMEAAGEPVPKWIEALAYGAPFSFEAVSVTVTRPDAQSYPINEDPNPDAGGQWAPVDDD